MVSFTRLQEDTNINWKKMSSANQTLIKTELGISELKWTGMEEFNSDDHYTYYCRQGSLRRKGAALTVNKSLKYNN